MTDETKKSAKILGGFEVRRELGRGGMGVVYEAYDRLLDRTIALKILPRQLAKDPSSAARFLNEARAAAKLTHPNIITVYAVGEDQGRQFIAMELIRGKSLYDCVQSGKPLPVRDALELVRQSANALAYAHAHGIIHRDIKPQNIMLDNTGRIRVLDFGLAKVAEGVAGLTSTGAILGTPRYMSPEQVKGKPADARSDIYSLGVVLYELATGTRAYDGGSPMAMMYQVVHEPLKFADPAGTRVPRSLIAIIEKMTAKDPAGRYQSCSDLLLDFDAVLASSPLAGAVLDDTVPRTTPVPKADSPPTGLPDVRSFTGQSRRIRFGALGAGIVALALLTTVWLAWPRNTANFDHAQAKPILDSENVIPSSPGNNLNVTLVETPDGDLLAAWAKPPPGAAAGETAIFASWKTQSANQWSPPFEMLNAPRSAPVLFVDDEQRLWCFHTEALGDDRERTVYSVAESYSPDLAIEWSALKPIPQAGKPAIDALKDDVSRNAAEYQRNTNLTQGQLENAAAAAQSKDPDAEYWETSDIPVVLPGGAMLLPLSSGVFTCSIIAITRDNGETWQYSSPITSLAIQPSIVRRKDGSIVAYMRDESLRQRVQMAQSHDDGLTWSRAESTSILNTGNPVSCIALRSGRWVLATNDANVGWRQRGQLSIYLSEDEGASWKFSKVLDGPHEDKIHSYPSLIQTRDGAIHCLYADRDGNTDEKWAVKHARFNEAWLMVP